jgi:hypothetical protein
VQANLIESRKGHEESQIQAGEGGRERRKEPNATERENGSSHTSGQCQHETFGEEVMDDPGASGAERDPDRNFALSCGCAGEQQAGDIDTGYEVKPYLALELLVGAGSSKHGP